MLVTALWRAGRDAGEAGELMSLLVSESKRKTLLRKDKNGNAAANSLTLAYADTDDLAPLSPWTVFHTAACRCVCTYTGASVYVGERDTRGELKGTPLLSEEKEITHAFVSHTREEKQLTGPR